MVGGNSTAFGTIQAESSPRLVDILRSGPSTLTHNQITVPAGTWSQPISTGAAGINANLTFQFQTSADKVRPMVSLISGTVADIYLQNLEKHVIPQNPKKF